jgi:hypothetical protein
LGVEPPSGWRGNSAAGTGASTTVSRFQ